MLRPSLALFGLLLACSAESPGSPTPVDAGIDAKRRIDSGVRDAGVVDADPRLDRLQGGGKVLPNMKLGIIYIGDETEGAPSFDAYVTWLVSSSWWGIMKQYGVNAGTVVGSVRVPKSSVFGPGDVDGKGVTYWAIVDERVGRLVHPSGGGASVVPGADSYLVFLPWGVNVDVGGITCATVGGYHSVTNNGQIPYSIMPPCPLGHSGTAISHELAEMATDPFPTSGWYDPSEGLEGEIGDLCNAAADWEGHVVTRLWSNEAGTCVPD